MIILRFILCYFILTFCSICSWAQYIATVAGNGIYGYSGDGGAATAAKINGPDGVAIDTIGNLYIADNSNNCIRKVNNLGIISTFAGTGVWGYSGDGGPATAATFTNIGGLAFDKAGNLFIADCVNSRIRKINAAGIINTIAGNGTGGYTGDGGPATDSEIAALDVAIDTNGNVYIQDGTNCVIRKINNAGIISTIAGTGIAGFGGDGGPATSALLNFPTGLATDKFGNIYIADQVNCRIRKIDNTGIITTYAGTGVAGYSGDGGPATVALIGTIYSVFADDAGNVFLPDRYYISNCVRKINSSGIISTIAGNGVGSFSGDGGPATAAEIYAPDHVARYSNGNIYIADTRNNRIRMIITKPYFINGFLQHITFCHGTLNLDTLLAANDSNTGNTEVWGLVSGPAHGTAVVGYTAVSTGSVIYPTGLFYTSTPGYYGPDTIRVRVYDGQIADTTTLCLTIQGPPDAGAITGPDTVCLPSSITLTDAAPGGTWSASNTHASVGTTGIVTGLSPGPDSISYKVTNTCGTATATHAVRVKGCNVEVGSIPAPQGITIAPNPNGGSFTLTLPGNPQPAHITITNLLGQKIKEFTTATTTQNIQLNSPHGIYFLSVTTASGEWCSKVVVL